jgi:flagellar FliJ protein
MRRFRFALEKVLELRRYKEREWELKLAKITGECQLLKQEIQARTDELVRSMQACAQPGRMVVDMQNRWVHELFMLRLKQEREHLSDELELQESKRQEVQEKYFAASRERKVIEKLKERKAAEYMDMQKKEEIKQIDDINNSRYRRE